MAHLRSAPSTERSAACSTRPATRTVHWAAVARSATACRTASPTVSLRRATSRAAATEAVPEASDLPALNANGAGSLAGHATGAANGAGNLAGSLSHAANGAANPAGPATGEANGSGAANASGGKSRSLDANGRPVTLRASGNGSASGNENANQRNGSLSAVAAGNANGQANAHASHGH
jgi:hypothetical protein